MADEILGVYRVPVTWRTLRECWTYGRGFSRIVQLRNGFEVLRSCVLVEMRVTTNAPDFDLGEFCQERSPTPYTQAPYYDTWLDESGCHVIGTFGKFPRVPSARVAFFLHDFKADKPIYSPTTGPLPCHKPRRMPRRLRRIMKWEFPS